MRTESDLNLNEIKEAVQLCVLGQQDLNGVVGEVGSLDSLFKKIPEDKRALMFKFLQYEVGIDVLHNLTIIPSGMFSGDMNMMGILEIPSNIREIEPGAFSGLKYIRTLVILAELFSTEGVINTGTIVNCDALTRVKVISRQFSRFWKDAIQNCPRLQEIIIYLKDDEYQVALNENSFSNISPNYTIVVVGGTLSSDDYAIEGNQDLQRRIEEQN